MMRYMVCDEAEELGGFFFMLGGRFGVWGRGGWMRRFDGSKLILQMVGEEGSGYSALGQGFFSMGDHFSMEIMLFFEKFSTKKTPIWGDFSPFFTQPSLKLKNPPLRSVRCLSPS